LNKKMEYRHSTKCGKFLDYLRRCQLLKKVSAAWSYIWATFLVLTVCVRWSVGDVNTSKYPTQ
jgi:hypothetical protein